MLLMGRSLGETDICAIAPNDPVCVAFYQSQPKQVFAAAGANIQAAINAATTPWYKKWWGIGLLVAGGVGGVALYKKKVK